MGRHYITGKFKGGEGGWSGITLPESSKGVRRGDGAALHYRKVQRGEVGGGRHYITGKFNKPQWILKNLIEPSHLQLSQSLTTAETQPSVLVKVTTL